MDRVVFYLPKGNSVSFSVVEEHIVEVPSLGILDNNHREDYFHQNEIECKNNYLEEKMFVLILLFEQDLSTVLRCCFLDSPFNILPYGFFLWDVNVFFS